MVLEWSKETGNGKSKNLKTKKLEKDHQIIYNLVMTHSYLKVVVVAPIFSN